MAPIDVYIFRHGETDWNLERRFQGHTDIPLNANGRRQAQELATVLETLGLEAFLSSDLSRALETTRIANESLQLPLFENSDLREAYLGEAEGMLRDDIIAKYGGDSWEQWISVAKESLDFAYPGGETKRQLLKRTQCAIENFLAQNSYRRIGVATHGAVMRRLAHAAMEQEAEPLPMPNCAIYLLEFERSSGRWSYRGPVKGVYSKSS